MKNAEFPASGIPETDHSPFYGGLTKREMFAMHFMQAWIQHHGAAGDYGFSKGGAAESAIECADALLEKLEQAK